MTTPVNDELGFYVLAGQPKSSRDLVDEVRAGEALGFGTAFISERYNKKEAATLSGAAGAVSERIVIQTAATNHNTRHPMVTAGFAAHHAEPHRWTLRARPGSRHPPAAGRVRHRPHHDGPDGGLRRDHAPAVPRRGDLRPRRPGRQVPAAAPRRHARRAPADERRRVRSEHTRARRPLLRRGRAAHVLHRRDHGALRADGEARGRASRDAIPRRCACGRASRPSAITCPRTSG